MSSSCGAAGDPVESCLTGTVVGDRPLSAIPPDWRSSLFRWPPPGPWPPAARDRGAVRIEACGLLGDHPQRGLQITLLIILLYYRLLFFLFSAIFREIILAYPL